MKLIPVKIPLFVPFTTALHSVNIKNAILVQLKTESGLVGWGEASPEIEITGDDHNISYKVLNDNLKDIVLGAKLEERGDLTELLTALSRYIELSSTAVAGVDIALHDLWSKITHVPLYALFGGTPRPLKTSISIGIMETDALLNQIRTITASGATSIKLKIGSGIDEDVELIRTVREHFKDSISLRLDANQAYSAEDTLTLMTRLEDYDIEFIEQPVPASDLGGLKKVNELGAIPVMADEAVRYFGDLSVIGEGGICNKVNLKLMKSGGLFQVNKFIKYCASNNLKAMIGCMVETPIGISAGVHLALQGGAVNWTDLDGHLFLKNIDVIFSGLSTEKGQNNVTDVPGLGLTVDDEALRDIVTDTR